MSVYMQMKDWLLTLIVLLLVALDVIILVVYTGLECTVSSGATRVVNREQEISSTGVSHSIALCHTAWSNVLGFCIDHTENYYLCRSGKWSCGRSFLIHQETRVLIRDAMHWMFLMRSCFLR